MILVEKGRDCGKNGRQNFSAKITTVATCGSCSILAALAICDILARKMLVATIEFQLHLFW